MLIYIQIIMWAIINRNSGKIRKIIKTEVRIRRIWNNIMGNMMGIRWRLMLKLEIIGSRRKVILKYRLKNTNMSNSKLGIIIKLIIIWIQCMVFWLVLIYRIWLHPGMSRLCRMVGMVEYWIIRLKNSRLKIRKI